MRILKVLSIVLLSALVFSGCNPETGEPTIAWEGNLSKTMDFAVETNYLIDIDVVVDAEAGITNFVVNKYIHEGEDFTKVELDAPTAFNEQTSYTYNFTEIINQDDFPAGVTKLVFEFEITDAENRVITKEFTVFIIAYYTVTFDVKDATGAPLADAVVTFGDSTYDAGVYVLENIEIGAFDYSVTKDGYSTVTFVDYEVDADFTIDVVLTPLLSAWEGPIYLALEGQQTWASYDGNAVDIFQSNDIGTWFYNTNGVTFNIKPTTNCDGFVVVDDITTLVSPEALDAAYTDGTVVNVIELECDQNKNYVGQYYIAKIGTSYVLVNYVMGQRDAATGNVIGLEYKM